MCVCDDLNLRSLIRLRYVNGDGRCNQDFTINFVLSFQYYFVHKKAPTFEHRLIPFDENCVIKPAERTLPELPHQFAKFVEKVIFYSKIAKWHIPKYKFV